MATHSSILTLEPWLGEHSGKTALLHPGWHQTPQGCSQQDRHWDGSEMGTVWERQRDDTGERERRGGDEGLGTEGWRKRQETWGSQRGERRTDILCDHLFAWASKTHSIRCLRWGTFLYSRGHLQPPWSELTWCHGLY